MLVEQAVKAGITRNSAYSTMQHGRLLGMTGTRLLDHMITNGQRAGGMRDMFEPFPSMISGSSLAYPGMPYHNKKEEDDLQLALAISKQMEPSSSSSASSFATGMSAEDLQIAEIVERSRQENGAGVSEDDSQNKLREEGVPVGLKNVGNSCYFNSMLQSYFNIPQLRKLVLTYQPQPPSGVAASADPSSASPTNPPTLSTNPTPTLSSTSSSSNSSTSSSASTLAGSTFMLELRKIFCKLILSNQKFIDPSSVLREVTSRSGGQLQVGRQEDVSEFDNLFTDLIERSLASDCIEGFTKIFQGHKLTITSATEADGTPVETRMAETVGSIILPVPDLANQVLHLLDCFDRALTDSIEDYETEQHHRTLAHQTTWFESLPPILKIQLNRTAFNEGTANKIHTPVRIPTRLSLDRFKLANRDRCLELRAGLAAKAEHLQELRSRLLELTQFVDPSSEPSRSPLHLANAVAGIVAFLQRPSGPPPLEPELVGEGRLAPVIAYLTELGVSLDERIGSLEKQCRELAAHIDNAFEPLETTHYDLQAVWIHEGVPGSGHYWVYLRVPEQPTKWFKYNDSFVTEAPEEEVFERATGGAGSGRCSAYLLIYTLPLPEGGLDWAALVPPQLAQEIASENAGFATSQSALKAKPPPSDAKVQSFFEVFDRKVAAAQVAEPPKLEADARITHLENFAYSLGEIEAATAAAFLSTYSNVFMISYKNDLSSPMQEQIAQRLGSERAEIMLRYAIEAELMQRIEALHAQFRCTADLVRKAISDMVNYRVERALQNLYVALESDRKLPDVGAIKRTPEILKLAVDACIRLIKEGMRAADIRDQHRAEIMFRAVGHFANHLIPLEQRERILMEFNTVIEAADRYGASFQELLWVILEQLNSAPAPETPAFSQIFGPSAIKPIPSQLLSQHAADMLYQELGTLIRGGTGRTLPQLS